MGSVYVEPLENEWMYYEKGILSHEPNAPWQMPSNGKYKIDHNIIIAGWGPNYWILKNSWGKCKIKKYLYI